MAYDFPSSPTEGQTANGFVYRSGEWQRPKAKTALPKNYLLNSVMKISQENGDVSSASTATGNYYPADQWVASWGLSPGTINSGRTRVAPAGSDCISMTVATAMTTPSAGAYMQFFQKIEGQRVADLRWGTADARQAVFQFSLYSVLAGTYSVQVKNNAGDRTFLAPFTIPANSWSTFSVVVPGDTTGTWPTGNSAGIQVGLGLASGTTYGGGVAGWQAGNKVQIAGNTNGANTGSIFLFSNTGFYADPYNTGIAPPFDPPIYDAELRRCQRYWYKQVALRGVVTGTTTVGRASMVHPVPMRATPTGTIVGAPKMYDGAVTPAITSISSACNSYAAEFDVTCSAGGMTAGRPGVQYEQGLADYIAMSARM